MYGLSSQSIEFIITDFYKKAICNENHNNQTHKNRNTADNGIICCQANNYATAQTVHLLVNNTVPATCLVHISWICDRQFTALAYSYWSWFSASQFRHIRTSWQRKDQEEQSTKGTRLALAVGALYFRIKPTWGIQVFQCLNTTLHCSIDPPCDYRSLPRKANSSSCPTLLQVGVEALHQCLLHQHHQKQTNSFIFLKRKKQ